MGMRHVLNLDSDWFAVPGTGPEPTDDQIIPAVGDVLDNVRTYHVPGTTPPTYGKVWANPPFLRVAEVLPITRDHQRKPHVLPTVGGRAAWVIRKSRPDQLIDLDPQPLGGWAVRVEEADLHDEPDGWILHDLTRRPPRFDGAPLNQEAQR